VRIWILYVEPPAASRCGVAFLKTREEGR